MFAIICMSLCILGLLAISIYIKYKLCKTKDLLSKNGFEGQLKKETSLLSSILLFYSVCFIARVIYFNAMWLLEWENFYFVQVDILTQLFCESVPIFLLLLRHRINFKQLLAMKIDEQNAIVR